MLGILKKIFGADMKLLRSEAGGVAVYSAFIGLMAVGTGALAVDIGRASVLRSQMQNRADAGALAAAAQLDGRAGAQERALAVGMNATKSSSAIPSDNSVLAVNSVKFYSEYTPDKIFATGDEDSRFVEVELATRQIDYVLTGFISTPTKATDTHSARAVGRSDPFICHAPPLMLCDPGEADGTMSLADADNAGRQIQLMPPPAGGTAWSPGNYGLLALPDGSIGASDISKALSSVVPDDCYNLDVSTAPGVKTNKVKDGVNARFDIPGGLPLPAPNVMNYPKDPEIEASTATVMGSGNWDIATYWADRHIGPLPTALTDASRYQVYLFELGFEFARNGKKTIYPLAGGLPAGYTTVTPDAADIPVDAADSDNPYVDGVPSQAVAENGHARRLVQIAVLQCAALGVKGSHTYPTSGNFVEAFITQAVESAPAGGIYVEMVRPLTTTNDPDFHSNARLVE
ncbi:MAG: hypothetical protein HQ503_02950 [Rhodospirillales bacterium]|nr:hypothetical protein [Rhodospirillales bacterium]